MGWNWAGDDDEDEIPDSEYGGVHFMGTGTYEARTPAQARALYAQLPQGSREDQQFLAATADYGDEPDDEPDDEDQDDRWGSKIFSGAW
jgi:hypothetical protein